MVHSVFKTSNLIAMQYVEQLSLIYFVRLTSLLGPKQCTHCIVISIMGFGKIKIDTNLQMHNIQIG